MIILEGLTFGEGEEHHVFLHLHSSQVANISLQLFV